MYIFAYIFAKSQNTSILMAEELHIEASASKEEKYLQLFPQLEALLSGETDLIANLANTAAALHDTFGWWWVGFYIVRGEELVLGPFQGPVACTRIRKGRGVCGTAWKNNQSLLVPDVNAFPGHIACSSLSVAEIVVPVVNSSDIVVAVLDVDSKRYDVLDETDVSYLEKLTTLLSASTSWQ